MEQQSVSVVLADDQVLFVDSLKTVLEHSTEDIEVRGIATNGREAVDLVATHRPSVVLMDVRMPEMDGVEATRIIRTTYPETQVVMLTTFDDDEYVFSALGYGAIGYLLKNIPTEELVVSLRAVRSGTMQISPSVAAKLLQRGAAESSAANGNVAVAYGSPETATGMQPSNGPGCADGDAADTPSARSTRSKEQMLASLSLREREILKLLRKGYHNKEIAADLSIHEQTVKNHLTQIYGKLGVDSRLQALQMLSGASLDP